MRTYFAIITFALGSFASAKDASLLTTTTQLETGYTSKDFIDFLGGVMEGAIDAAIDGSIVEECIENGEEMIHQVAEAIEDIQEGTKSSVKEGIELLGQVLQETSKEVITCKLAIEGFEKLAEMSVAFSHPLSFLFHAGKNLIINHVEITDEIEAAIDAWHLDEFHTSGYNIGEALEQIFIGSPYGNEEIAQVA